MNIVKAKIEDAYQVALIVSESHKDVAEKFNLNIDNNPKHPSFYNEVGVLSDIDRGEEYFLCEDHGVCIGCVAFVQGQSNIAYLKRLSVLPEYRNKGVGSLLVRYFC